jgi:hypothetical protein
MNDKFKTLLADLDRQYEELISMPAQSVDTVPNDAPIGGVYLFSENGIALYAGRTKRSIQNRVRDHVGTANDCPFAWRLARETSGKAPTYTKKGSRTELLQDPIFIQHYEDAKKRIRAMQVRYVGEKDPEKQALLEIYVAVVSSATFNDFDTH